MWNKSVLYIYRPTYKYKYAYMYTCDICVCICVHNGSMIYTRVHCTYMLLISRILRLSSFFPLGLAEIIAVDAALR